VTFVSPTDYARTVDQDELQSRARSSLKLAAETVYAAGNPGKAGPPGSDAAVLDPVVARLHEVLELLGPGVGPGNTSDGLPLLRKVVEEMEALMPSGGPTAAYLSADGRGALNQAIALLRRVERLYADA
jgi:hypothetical protein